MQASIFYENDQLFMEQVSLATIAKEFGTPCFVYSKAALVHNWQRFDKAFGTHAHQICYAVKANSNLAILNTFARLGASFDIVSGGELARVIAAGGDPRKIIFSGVGKTHQEISAALTANIQCFNVESLAELIRINAVAKTLKLNAPIALRVNPNIDAKTHPYISTGLKENKFGIAIDKLDETLALIQSLSHITLRGLACHIGSQLTELKPFSAALQNLITLYHKIEALGFELDHLDVGGGLGVCYQHETPPTIEAYVTNLLNQLGSLKTKLLIEPGRSLVANTGVMLTTVEYLKPTATKNFAVVDAAMNDLIRPALYDAWQAIVPLQHNAKAPLLTYDIVGPVCESGDFLGISRELRLAEQDILAVCGAGAYGFTMSSNYNTRPRAAEVMVDGDQNHLIRAREKVTDLFAHEYLLPV